MHNKPDTHEHEMADNVQALYEKRFAAIKDSFDASLIKVSRCLSSS